MKKLFLMSAFALMGVAANASTGTVVFPHLVASK